MVNRNIVAILLTLAEVVGFEPTVPCGTTVFKTAPINLSGTLPYSLADPAGFEPTTAAFEAQNSIQLS